MAGGVLLLSDKAEVYKDRKNLEGVKRSSPVLFTVPGQLYDHTPRGPAWSFENSFRDYCQKGGGEATWWLQEIDRPFEHWAVLARFQWGEGSDLNHRERRGAPAQEVKFADLGLEPEREYLVFEFWTQTFLGKAQGSFVAPAQDSNSAMQVFAIREARAHPWVLSTTRHISQGGVCLMDGKWDKESNILSGRSAVVNGDPYVLTVHLPAGFQTGMGAGAAHRLREAVLGASDHRVKVIASYQMLGGIDEDLRQALGLDVVGVHGPGTMFGFRNEGWKPFAMFDGTPVLVPGQFNVTPADDGGWLMYPEGIRGVDTQRTLPFGTPEEVYWEVRERIEILGEGGGYVFNSIHNIQSNVPTGNILAMFRAVRDSFS